MESNKKMCDPEAHYAQIEFFGECSWCNELDKSIASKKGAK
jgi:hypothetical protein